MLVTSLHGVKFVVEQKNKGETRTNIYKNNINGIKMRYFIAFSIIKRQSEWTYFLLYKIKGGILWNIFLN